MSDLSATQCGCGCQSNFGGCGSNSCTWIIILLLLCGGCGGNGSLFNNDGCGCGGNDYIWIILILLFCGGNNSNGFGYSNNYGCNNTCGC